MTLPTLSPTNKWFVMRVVSTKEKKAKEYIESELPSTPWQGIIKQIFLPTEKIYRIVKGKKVIQERNYYPGYLMLESAVDTLPQDLIDFIKNTQFVIHFLGKDKPIALTEVEVQKIIGRFGEEGQNNAKETEMGMQNPFIVGETIKIIEGPFNDFHGTIEEVSEDKKKLKVVVKIFDRLTPVDLSFMQVEHIS